MNVAPSIRLFSINIFKLFNFDSGIGGSPSVGGGGASPPNSSPPGGGGGIPKSPPGGGPNSSSPPGVVDAPADGVEPEGLP
jgi:hypothetical protein